MNHPRIRRPALAVAAISLVSLLVAGSAVSGAAAASWSPPPTTGFVDYQLGGSYAVPAGVTVVGRDSTSSPAKGVYSICYINGFQSQPADHSYWTRQHKSLLLYRGGKPIVDANWPDELILNTSTASKRASIAKHYERSIAACAKKGFAAIEIDNLDSFTRSRGRLNAHDNKELAKLYARSAHAHGMAIAQKNTAEFARTWKKAVGFDFAVAEECYRWDECGVYKKAYGSKVIDIEYTDDLRGTFAKACADPDSPALMALRDRDLRTPKSKHYRYDHC